MNFPAIIEVAIGLALLYFLIANLGTIVVELMAGKWRWRHQFLRATVNRLLGDDDHRRAFWSHPTIQPLGVPSTGMRVGLGWLPDRAMRVSRFVAQKVLQPFLHLEPASAEQVVDRALAEGPSYLDSAHFAAVVFEQATGGGRLRVPPRTLAELDAAISTFAGPSLRATLHSLLQTVPPATDNAPDGLRTAIGDWFDEAMARTTGAYKRKVQRHLFGFGLSLAIVLNLDTLRISRELFSDPTARAAIVGQADQLIRDAEHTADAPAAPARTPAVSPTGPEAPPSGVPVPATAAAASPAPATRADAAQAIRQLRDLVGNGFPIGWLSPWRDNLLPQPPWGPLKKSFTLWIAWGLILKILGLCTTAFAVCLGAPFWFDMLSRLVKLRTSGGLPKTDDGSGAANPASSAAPVAASSVAAGAAAPPAPAAGAGVAKRPLPPLHEALAGGSAEFDVSKTYWCAELSRLAYEKDETVARATAAEWGFDRQDFIADAKTDTQVLLLAGGGLTVLAFRGTESARDWLTDAKAALLDAPEFGGAVHTGFHEALASVYPSIVEKLTALGGGSPPALYITGHSLGAALATLAACRLIDEGRCHLLGLQTFGSPRVGDARFERRCTALLGRTVFRVVNNEDLVTRVPPPPVYAHVGEAVFLDPAGRIHQGDVFWYRMLDFAANATANLEQAAKLTVQDHAIELYCAKLRTA